MKKSDFEGLVQEIVIEIYPTEKTAFNLSKDRLFNDLYGKEFELIGQKDSQGEFNFLEETGLALQFITVMIATYKFVKDYLIKEKKEENIEEFKNSWKKKLMEKGLSEKDAKRIVNSFSKKLMTKLSQKDESKS